MNASSSARRAAALGFAAVVFAGALPATAKAEPASDDCTTMAPIGHEFRSAVKGLFSPEEIKQMKAAKSKKGADQEDALSKVMGRVFEKDPKTGESRLVGFLGHLRRVDELAHDMSGQLDDPQAADAVEKLATGLDDYFAFYDRALNATDGSDKDQADDKDQAQDGEQAEDSPSSTSLSQLGPVLEGFVGGIEAYGDYMDEHCASAGGSGFTEDAKH